MWATAYSPQLVAPKAINITPVRDDVVDSNTSYVSSIYNQAANQGKNAENWLNV
jgi:hypothetical protein